MLRFPRAFLGALLIAFLGVLFVPLVVMAQQADSLHVVLPTGCTGVACVKSFLVENQMYLAMGLSSTALFFLSQLPWFAKLGNWTTRVVQLGIGFVVSLIVTAWGGAVDPALTALVSSALSVILGGLIFRMGRTQPGNNG